MSEKENNSGLIAPKKVDESWKTEVEKEKDKVAAGPGEGEKEEKDAPEADFYNFISGLGMQVLMFLGEIPDPVSKQKQKNLPQAKYLIDILLMLREKTKGNLSQEEEGLLEGIIHELQMKYVKAVERI